MPRITNMYTVQKTLGLFFLIHKLECVHYCVQDVTAFRVFHTSIETLITIMFLLFLVYLLDMVLSNICKSLGFESAFLPRIIGKVCDLCCLCPS